MIPDIRDLSQSALNAISLPEGVQPTVTETNPRALFAEARTPTKLLVLGAREQGDWFDPMLAISVDVYTGPDLTYAETIRFSASRSWLAKWLKEPGA